MYLLKNAYSKHVFLKQHNINVHLYIFKKKIKNYEVQLLITDEDFLCSKMCKCLIAMYEDYKHKATITTHNNVYHCFFELINDNER